ncbi:hypothetical protein Ga0123462_1972 [Mariprofundus ferrinatatus]|uniref:DUF1318 domain-containing protein n=1 Tax=Mariprofundus ferrinatatus TaxID=1921087 RepID=A0A2K8L973_9PROT|nr:YdbL family protein [Mariprofundus ferrinatatus]ATX82809.1 hypothetical protein Ga0123462_1972 [Mariprofundus ferrinatatus]
MKGKFILFRLLAILVMSFSVAGLNATTAWSADLQSAKAAGQVGEKPDGYLGIVSGGPGVAGMVQDINQKRRAAYQNIARKNGTSLQAVEQLAGRKAIDKTPPGQYVMTPSGQWVRK